MDRNQIRIAALSCSFIACKLPRVRKLRNIENLITITIGIDGLPLSHSTKLQFWPILGKIDQAKTYKVFVISLYCGYQKPQRIEEFLNPFVEELMELEKTGVVHEGSVFNVRLSSIRADAPARSLIKCTVNPQFILWL